MFKFKKCKRCGTIEGEKIICDECKKKVNALDFISCTLKTFIKNEDFHFCNRICFKKWIKKNV